MWLNLRLQKDAFSTQHMYCTCTADWTKVRLAGCSTCWSLQSRRGRTNANAIAKTKKTWPKILLMTTLWRRQVWSHSFSLRRHVNEAALDSRCHSNGSIPVLHPSSSFFWFLRSPSVSHLWLWTSTWSHVLQQVTAVTADQFLSGTGPLGSVFRYIHGHFAVVRARSCPNWGIMPACL